MDSHGRSWVKALVWLIIGIFVLGGLSWMFTHNWAKTSLITITFHGIRTVAYYYHERLWEKINWGRKRVVQEDYII